MRFEVNFFADAIGYADMQASIHAIIESDDRVAFVIENLDDALAELDRLDAMFRMFKSQLNVRFSFFHLSSTVIILCAHKSCHLRHVGHER